jgi:Zn-dependent peptidase ImmA (M78 family)
MKLNREWRGLSIEEVADLSGISAAKIQAFEDKDDRPLWGEIDRLARVYKVSKLALADPKPVPPAPALADFRTIAGRPVTYTLQIASALADARELQEAAADIISESPGLYRMKELMWTSLDDDPAKLALRYRREFGITTRSHQAASSASVFFSIIRSRIEDLGIFVVVMKAGNIEDDCRGFALMDGDVPPVIVINTREEAGGARIFSLLHEFAHILLRAPGVSGAAIRNKVERFCNVFATEFLMPAAVMQALIGPPGIPREPAPDDVRKYANRIKCSQQALALRLEELGYAPTGYYERWLSVMKTREKPKAGFAPMAYPERMVRRLGTGFSSLILNALNTEAISEVDAFRAINVQPKYYDEMAAVIVDIQERVIAESG